MRVAITWAKKCNQLCSSLISIINYLNYNVIVAFKVAHPKNNGGIRIYYNAGI